MEILLENEEIKATFLPDEGMTLASFKRSGIEVIDQTTKKNFESHRAGLGPLIGPHFLCRKKELIPPVEQSLFPHIQGLKEAGEWDPFSHGVARYAKWNVTATKESVSATLTGEDTLNGIPLKDLEGQDFKMEMHVELKGALLNIKLTVVSHTDSLVGIHYYYALPEGKGRVFSTVDKNYIKNHSETKVLETSSLDYSLEDHTDFTFHPRPNSRMGEISLETSTHQLITRYSSTSAENCWQLYHPRDSRFVCIEPISASDPCHPNLSVSGVDISLEIIPN
ncbi:MAG: hypothetical protein WD595_06775 [Waddliaceae bacterium]